MKIKCPVALCGWEGKSHQFHKHIEEYKITWKNVMDSGFPRSESHDRWANYFFKEIWNDPNLPEKVKWTNIAIAYVNQSKKQNKMQHKKLSPDGSDNIEMKDGKIMMFIIWNMDIWHYFLKFLICVFLAVHHDLSVFHLNFI